MGVVPSRVQTYGHVLTRNIYVENVWSADLIIIIVADFCNYTKYKRELFKYANNIQPHANHAHIYVKKITGIISKILIRQLSKFLILTLISTYIKVIKNKLMYAYMFKLILWSDFNLNSGHDLRRNTIWQQTRESVDLWTWN